MKQFFFTLVTMSFLLMIFFGCEKDEMPTPMDELQDVIKVSPPLALTAPSDGRFTLENPCTNEDLLMIEQERILKEQQSLNDIKGLPDGTHEFSYDVTLTKSVAGTTLYENDYAKGEVTAGGIIFTPKFYWKAYISGGVLQNTEAYIKNTVTFDPTFKITMKKSVSKTYSTNLIDESKTVYSIVGGILPIWITLRAKLDAGSYMYATASCWMQQKIKIVSYIKIGAKWVNGTGWSNISSTPYPTYTAYSPSYGWNGSLAIQPFMKAEVSANLYSVLGPRMTVTPYFYLYLNASSRYIDRTAYLKGDIYFSLSGLGDTDLYSRNLFNVSKSFSRIYF